MEVQTALSRLTDAELVFCRGTPPQAIFLFKPALIRDVADSANSFTFASSQRSNLNFWN
jgi:hypothetical protein